MTIQSGFVPEITEGEPVITWEVVDTDYPTQTVYVTREVYEPAAPAYYTVIPNSHCSKSGGERFLTAPILANKDGSEVILPTIHEKKDEQTGKVIGQQLTGYGELVIRQGLSYEDYLRAVKLLGEIERGEHHIETGGLLEGGQDNISRIDTFEETFFMRKETVDQEGGPSRPLLVDIEKRLRVSPPDPATGVIIPPPDTKEGFVPLGGDSGVAPTAALPPADGTHFKDGYDVATNKDWIKGATDPTKRDQINKYFTPPEASPSGKQAADRTIVSNDTVLFTPTDVPVVTNPKDSVTLPRTFTSP